MDKGKVKELFLSVSKQFGSIGNYIIATIAIAFIFGIFATNAADIKLAQIMGIVGVVLSVSCWSMIALKCLSIQKQIKQIANHFGEE